MNDSVRLPPGTQHAAPPASQHRPAPPANGAVTVPHPVLSDYYRDEGERRRFLDSIFDRTAPDYDSIEKLLGFGSGPWYRGQALRRAGLGPGMALVDVGVGTGLVARQAVRIVGDPALVTGVDPSAGMLAAASLPGVRLVQGTGEAIPLTPESQDFVSMGYALRHLASLRDAFAEFHRVLRPGGRVLVLEITRPTGRFARTMLKAYMRGVVPPLARLWSRSPETARIWRYYWETIEACVPPESVLATLEAAGFRDVHRHVELGIFSEYRARRA